MVRATWHFVALMVCTSFATAQQSGVSLTANQLSGFRHVFLSLGSPSLKQADVDRRLANFGTQFGLSAAETQILAGVIGEFRQTLNGLVRAKNRQEAAQIEQSRDGRIHELASKFLFQLPTTKQNRILTDLQDPSHGHSSPPTRR